MLSLLYKNVTDETARVRQKQGRKESGVVHKPTSNWQNYLRQPSFTSAPPWLQGCSPPSAGLGSRKVNTSTKAEQKAGSEWVSGQLKVIGSCHVHVFWASNQLSREFDVNRPVPGSLDSQPETLRWGVQEYAAWCFLTKPRRYCLQRKIDVSVIPPHLPEIATEPDTSVLSEFTYCFVFPGAPADWIISGGGSTSFLLAGWRSWPLRAAPRLSQFASGIG